MIIIKFVSILLISLFYEFSLGGPIQVRVEKNNNNNFDVGPAPRTIFELVDGYHPLSTAYNQQNRPRAMFSSLSKGPTRRVNSSAQILVEFGEETINNNTTTNVQTQQGRYYYSKGLNNLNAVPMRIRNNNVSTKPKKSYWLEWTQWSNCADGERIRIRQCLVVANIECEGESEQRQHCFQFQSQVPVAKDPLVIEKEILGIYLSDQLR